MEIHGGRQADNNDNWPEWMSTDNIFQLNLLISSKPFSEPKTSVEKNFGLASQYWRNLKQPLNLDHGLLLTLWGRTRINLRVNMWHITNLFYTLPVWNNSVSHFLPVNMNNTVHIGLALIIHGGWPRNILQNIVHTGLMHIQSLLLFKTKRENWKL